MSSTDMNRFEKLLQQMQTHSGGVGNFRNALIEVADTAYACKLWFESYGLAATASDVVAMTRLVIEREMAITTAEAKAAEVEDED